MVYKQQKSPYDIKGYSREIVDFFYNCKLYGMVFLFYPNIK
jgi:hypothetical protein